MSSFEELVEEFPSAQEANQRRLEFMMSILLDTIRNAIGRGAHKVLLERPLFDKETEVLESNGYSIQTYVSKYSTHTIISWDENETLSDIDNKRKIYD